MLEGIYNAEFGSASVRRRQGSTDELNTQFYVNIITQEDPS